MKRWIILFFIALSAQVLAQIEAGDIEWGRDYHQALRKAKASDKLVYIQFQEIPGCATCRNYGSAVLSHPSIVYALENAFVPLLIHNNKEGLDSKILKKYNEPSWNNPVSRIVDTDGENVVDRLSGKYDALSVVKLMNAAYLLHQGEVPQYLDWLEEELIYEGLAKDTIYLSMYCFWTGEREIGKMKGVYQTMPGFMHGKEVVQTVFVPSVISRKTLIKQAKDQKCAQHCYGKNSRGRESVKPIGKFKADRTPQYYFSKSKFSDMDLTPFQRMKINAYLDRGEVYIEEVLNFSK